jgi:DNA-binding PadR family transcriptional regulator
MEHCEVGSTNIDQIDIDLLKRCQEKPGSTLADVFEPFTNKLSERALYNRLIWLEASGLIRVDRASRKGRSLAEITQLGKEALTNVGSTRPTSCRAGGSL